MELMSDVPIGCFLSGGIDSSAIAAYASKFHSSRLHTFCYKFAERTHDESADAREVAARLGSEHHEVIISEADTLSGLESMMDSLDEPFSDSTFLTLSLLSREVSKSVKVVLTGMGGDEVFTGYPTIRAHRYQNWFRMLPKFVRMGIIPPIINSLPVSDKYFSFEFKAKRFIRGQEFPSEIQHFIWMQNFQLDEKASLLQGFSPERSLAETYANVSEELSRCDAKDTMNRIMYLDMKFFLENNGLFQVDRSTMAYSLEARVPLLNKLTMDTLFQIPFAMKFYKGETKRLLKDAMRDFFPGNVLTRPKKGFGPPVSIWLRTFMREFMQDAIGGDSLKGSPLNPNLVNRMIREHLERKADHGRALWTILVFHLWWRKYA